MGLIADAEGHAPADPVAKDEKKNKHLGMIGVALTAAGILVAIFLSRRAAASGTAAPSTVGSSGLVAGSGSDSDTANSIGELQGGLNQQLQAFSQASNDQFNAFTDQQTKVSGDLQDQLAANNQANYEANQGLASALDSLTAEVHASTGASAADLNSNGWDPSTLAPVNAANSPTNLGANTPVDVIGTWVNGGLSGHNVAGGAPVYAQILTPFGYEYSQNFNPATLAPGSSLATLPQFSGYVNPATVAPPAAAKAP